MYDSLLVPDTSTLMEPWSESGYGLVDAESLEPDNPVREFHDYYRSLVQCGLPRWDQFDICAVPRHVVPHIALGRPEYGANPVSGGDTAPDHFVYTLEGGAVRALIGSSVVGQRVGNVQRFTTATTLRDELRRAVTSRQTVCSRSDLDLDDRANLRITRGLFLFSGWARSIEKLVLVVSKAPTPKLAG